MGGKLAGSGDLVGQFGNVFRTMPKVEKSYQLEGCYIPENFRPGDYFELPELTRCDEEAIYFVSRVYEGMAANDFDPVPLKAEKLLRLMGKNYKFVVDRLLSEKVVERFAYEPGEISFQYLLSEERFGSCKSRYYKFRRPVMIERLARQEQEKASGSSKAAQCGINPIVDGLYQRIETLSIDAVLANDLLANLPNPEKVDRYGMQTMMIEKLEQGHHMLVQGRLGRISNNITSMKKEVRKALRIDGSPLANVDIRNSQPTLLSNLIRNKQTGTHRINNRHRNKQQNRTNRPHTHYDLPALPPTGRAAGASEGPLTFDRSYRLGMKTALTTTDSARTQTKSVTAPNGSVFDLPNVVLFDQAIEGMGAMGLPSLDLNAPDVSKYIELTTTGRFYEFLLERYTISFEGQQIDRQKVKKKFLTDVIAYEGFYKSNVRELFRKDFPTVFELINRVNRSDHGNMIRLLQGLEVKIVIHRVAPLLMEQYPDLGFVTLHDSIYTRNDCIQWVKKAFDDVINAEELCFQLSVETG